MRPGRFAVSGQAMNEPDAGKISYLFHSLGTNPYSMSASAGFEIVWMPKRPSVDSLQENEKKS